VRVEPYQLPARELARRIEGREVSAVEVLEAKLRRIEERNPALNAIVSMEVDGARAAAAEADAALARGETVGPLHGVPMTLKDAIDVAGLRTTLGTDLLDRVADRDSTVAARLQRAGAIVFGHSNVPPWLADYQSANPIFGRTANPWDLGRTAGGSSGGAAAAVAAGLTPLEVGSDLAGSLRLPAHFCGVYGLKPTEHRVPLTGFFHQPGVPRPVRIAGSLGPIARDIDDLRLALGLIAGPDQRDGDVPPVPLAEPAPREELRVAAAPSLPGVTVARDLRELVERVASGASDAGARVDERLPEIDWAAQGELFGKLVATITGVFDPTADLPDEQRTLAWYLGALDQRDRLIGAWEEFFDDVDALVLPPAMTAAFPHRESGGVIEVDGKEVGYWEQGGPMVFANLCGLPALVAPAGRDRDGLPIGIQLVGPRWSELRLLTIARELEEAGVLPGFEAPPAPEAAAIKG
jgi:amidase